MSENLLIANIRENTGKGPSRRYRAQGILPAVIYGKQNKNVAITVCPKETSKALMGPLRRNALLKLKIEGDKPQEKLVMMKERQIHPVRRELVHIDFVEVDLKTPVTVSIPVILYGKSQAVVMGGKLDHVLKKIKLNCIPNNVPENIKIDISKLDFGSLHTSEVALPEGASLAEKPKVVVLTIKKPRGQKAGTEEEAKEAAK